MTFKLESENLSQVGGPMWKGDPTTINWTRYFTSVRAAKYAAELDYGDGKRKKIKWTSSGKKSTSGDLGHVMYNIEPIKLES